MQLFPDTHPATLHTVLMLCKNDFYSAVDKMLYAKKCKLASMNTASSPKPKQNKKARIETVVTLKRNSSAAAAARRQPCDAEKDQNGR